MNSGRSVWSRSAIGALALLAALAMGGCGSDDTPRAVSPSQPIEPTLPSPNVTYSPFGWQDEAAAAPEVGRVGPTEGCKLPGSFGVTEKWTARDVSDLGVVDEGMEMRCEIDANRLGIIGAIRIWVVTDESQPRAGLEKFIGKSVLHPAGLSYRDVKVGSADGAEAIFQFQEHSTRAFAVGTSTGQVLVVIWGAETTSYEAGMPAYLLARSTYRPAG